MSGSRRRRGLGATVLGAGVVLGSVALTAAPAGAAIGGYEIATGADAVAWVPILPGFVPGADSPGEISVSDTAASLASGGVAYGRGALNYPGSFGAHLGPLMQEEGAPGTVTHAIPPWPTLAEASGRSGSVTNNQVPGATIQAYGAPEKATGDSTLPGLSVPGLFEVGSVSTHSVSQLGSGSTPLASSTTILHDISVAKGLVTIATLSSTSSVRATDPGGAVTITDMRVAGTPVSVDATGVHVSKTSAPGTDLNAVLRTLASADIRISLAKPLTSRTGASVSRQTGGLVISVGTPESPAASAGQIVVEFGATSAEVAASSAGTGGQVAPVTGASGAAAPPSLGPAGGAGSFLPAVAAGALDATPVGPGVAASPGRVGATSPGAGPAPEAVATAYAYGGPPVAVLVGGLVFLGLAGWGVSMWARRMAAFRGGEIRP